MISPVCESPRARSEGGLSPRRPRAGSPAYFEGFAAGVDAFRITGGHEVPRGHPLGSTPEGRDWMLGCCAALEQCEASFSNRTTKYDDE